MINHFASMALGLVACVAASCSFMAPQPDRTQYFVLLPAVGNDSAAVSPATKASTSQLSLGVGPIKFPGYLKRPGVVIRASSGRLLVSDEERWGEPLDRNFEGILGQNLAQILGTQSITTYPWYADTHVDYQIEVRVDRFEASDDGQSQLTAVWIIKSGQDGGVLATGQSTATAPVQGGDPAGSAALSQDLGDMSRQIAERIIALNDRAAKPRATWSTPAHGAIGITLRSQ